MSDEDFCIEHGRDFMRFDRGPIPYCAKCEEPDPMTTTDRQFTHPNAGRRQHGGGMSKLLAIFVFMFIGWISYQIGFEHGKTFGISIAMRESLSSAPIHTTCFEGDFTWVARQDGQCYFSDKGPTP